MTEEARQKLITDGNRIRRSIAKLATRLEAIDAQLVTLPKGTYRNAAGQAVQVIDQQPGATTYKLAADKLDEARALCGRRFGTLFDRLVIHQPCSEFAAVASRIFPEDKAQAVTALCAVPGKAGKKYVRWS